MIFILMAYLFAMVPAQNPCVANPLRVTNVKLPTAATGNKQISYTTSSTQLIASFSFTAPNVIVFTDTRGCTQTVRTQ